MQSLITFSHFSILSHSSALSIVGLPSFLKCFLLLALILSDLVFFSQSEYIWILLLFSTGWVLPLFTLIGTLQHSSSVGSSNLTIYLFVDKTPNFSKPNLPYQLLSHIFNSQLHFLLAQIYNWLSYLAPCLSLLSLPSANPKGKFFYWHLISILFRNLNVKLQILLWWLTILCLWP